MTSKISELLLLAVIFPCFLAGCDSGGSTEKIGYSNIQELLSAPEEVENGENRYVLETYLWRDFMPISPPDGKPLIAKITVVATESQTPPPTLDADRLWVIDGEKVWETEFSGERIPPESGPGGRLTKIARNGPKWGPGIEVDIVVRLVDETGNTRLLRASGQKIHRTS